MQNTLREALTVNAEEVHNAVLTQAPFSVAPEQDYQAAATLGRAVNTLPEGTRVSLLWAVRAVVQADGYVPGGTQEALLATFGGHQFAATLNQLADTLRRPWSTVQANAPPLSSNTTAEEPRHQGGSRGRPRARGRGRGSARNNAHTAAQEALDTAGGQAATPRANATPDQTQGSTGTPAVQAAEDAPSIFLAPLAASQRVDPLADGWQHLQDVNLSTELRQRVFTLRTVPLTIRGDYARIQTQVLAHLRNACYDEGQTNLVERVQAWTLFLLLPRLLLHRTARGGAGGARELRRRVRLFDEGQWNVLLEECRREARGARTAQRRSNEEAEEARLNAATALAERGELSHAARVLRSTGLAPGTPQTLAELCDNTLRPQELQTPLPPEPLQYQPQSPVVLDRTQFAWVLQEARRGLSAGLGGTRNEYLQLCLESETALDLLTDVAEVLARGRVPEPVVAAMAMSQLTALRKPNGRVRGICAGDTFRRLVAKCLARQKQQALRQAVAPANFGLADRSGTDGLIHLVRSLTEADHNCTVLSIDGVGAYDHVSRARMMQELWREEELRDLVPFVRMWLNRRSTFVWTDDEGNPHDVPQGEGGEQGDALMPALFCLAMKPALEEIQSRLGEGDLVLAYLDDVYILTRPERARAAYDVAAEVLSRVCGIQVNRGKLVCWNKTGADAPQGISELDTPGHRVWRGNAPAAENGIRVLGAPIGTDEYTAAEGIRAAQQEQGLLDALLRLNRLQVAWLLLLYCAAPRANYTLRTVPPRQALGYAQEHDRRVLATAAALLDVTLREENQGDGADLRRRQAQLPLRYGGFGLRSSVRTAPAAYWASWADSLQPLSRRYPQLGARLLDYLRDTAANTPPCLAAAQEAAMHLDAAGMENRPTWESLAEGARPHRANTVEVEPGDWQHGWQFYAANPLEHNEHNLLLGELRVRGTAGPARLRSCGGPNASV